MLDIRFIREHPEVVKEAARRKRIQVDVDALLEVDAQRRSLSEELDALRAQRNRVSREIPQLKGEARNKAILAMKEVAASIKSMEGTSREVEERYERLMLQVPNVPAEGVPEGEDDDDNVEAKRWGKPPTFSFEPADHIVLGERLDIIDIPRGAKISGTRSYFLKNEGALLEVAVCRFALDHIAAKGFTPMVVPHLVRDEAMIGTGYFPWGEEDTYRTGRDGLNLIGTSEVPLAAYHYDEILSEDELPKYYAGLSYCFRREAGSYGRDTRGLYRVHQFQKVEQVVVCRADTEVSRAEHEAILRNSEEVLQALRLPYRVVHVCTGAMGAPQVKKYDIETWMPSRGAYGETHSCSMMYDFQARRLKLRYRDGEGRIHFAHTLNNTVIASPRILIPILECFQQADGSVLIPEVLRSYINGLERITPKR